jgi:hypothetical protein
MPVIWTYSMEFDAVGPVGIRSRNVSGRRKYGCRPFESGVIIMSTDGDVMTPAGVEGRSAMIRRASSREAISPMSIVPKRAELENRPRSMACAYSEPGPITLRASQRPT